MTYAFHPIAEMFPLMQGDEYKALVADIRDQGQREPIWILDGQILDGRNRWRACQEIGIEPDIRAYTGDESLSALIRFVASLNLHRRHLTAGQKAAIGAEIMDELTATARERQRAAAHQTNAALGRDHDETLVAILPQASEDREGKARDQAAAAVGTGARYISDAKKLKDEAPDLFAQVQTGAITIPQAKRASNERKRAEDRQTRARAMNGVPARARWQLLRADITENHRLAEGIDVIITDPPYPREYLHVYDALGRLAAHALKPGGSLLAMVGQSYLPEIIASLTKHLTYHWTIAYLTPGGQAVQQFQRKAITFWKPVLWLVKGEYAGDWVSDVAKSDVNDNDKRYHHWGQSESGMAELVERFSKPGDTILDPFLGGGTTGAVAVQMGRYFFGIDCDESAITRTSERLESL